MYYDRARLWISSFVTKMMKKSILAKLILVNFCTVLLVLIITYVIVQQETMDLFSNIMNQYSIEPVAPTQLFMRKSMKYLVIGASFSLVIGIFINIFLNQIWIRNLKQIRDTAGEIAKGNYTQVDVRTNDEVGQLAHSVNQMSTDLRRMEEQRKELLMDVAHELRTPLTTMMGYFEGVKDGVLESGTITMELLQKETRRLQKLVESIHQLNNLEYSHTVIQMDFVDIRQVLREMWMLFEYKFSDKAMRVELNHIFDENEQPLWIRGNQDLLTQMFYNLFENAWRYTNVADELEIRIKKSHDSSCVEIQLENRGDQLQILDSNRLFDRFYRGERSRARSSGGVGVGLAIVKQVVQGHGGQVDAGSEEGLFQIRILLPLACLK